MVFHSYMEDDFTRMKQFYPAYAAQIRPLVEKCCDGMEYEGSRMYDEVPDKDMMQKLCGRIFDALDYRLPEPEVEPEDMDVFAMSCYRSSCVQSQQLVKELIMVMLYFEMYARRCCRNQCKRIRGCCG